MIINKLTSMLRVVQQSVLSMLLIVATLGMASVIHAQTTSPQQILTSETQTYSLVPDTEFNVTVSYSTSDGSMSSAGVAIVVFYDSSQLEMVNYKVLPLKTYPSTHPVTGLPIEAEIVPPSLVTSEHQVDGDNQDGLTETDWRVNIAWADQSKSEWPLSTDGCALFVMFQGETFCDANGTVTKPYPFEMLQVTFRTKSGFTGTILTVSGKPAKGGNGYTITTEQVEVINSIYSDASLASLSLGTTGAKLSPTFSPTTLDYTATVPNGTTSVAPTVTLSNTAATATLTSDTAITNGGLTLTYEVTAEDGTTAQTYTVALVELPPLSGDLAMLPPITTTNQSSYSLGGTCTPAGASVQVEIEGLSPDPAAVACISGATSDSWAVGGLNLSSLSDSASIAVTATFTDSGDSSETPGSVRKDTMAPMITVTDAMEEATGVMTTISEVDLGATAVDAVDPSPTLSSDSSNTFSLGNYTITWTAEDADGNMVMATQMLAVSDTTEPTISQSSVTLEATAPMTEVSVATLAATVTDAVDSAPSLSSSPSGPFAVGEHIITWTSTDASNNTATEEQMLIVEDTTDPTITVTTITVEATAAASAISADYLNVTVTDIADSNVTLTANPETLPLGTTDVTWTATDASDNVSTEVQSVTVVDTSGPVITAPNDKTITPLVMFPTNPADSATVIISFDDLGGMATANDLVEGMINATVTATVNGVEFGPGDTQSIAVDLTGGSVDVFWSVADSNGIFSTVTQVVSIFVTDSPVIIIPSTMVTIEATGVTTTVDLSNVTAVDAQDGTLTPTADNTGPFGLGTTTVTWTATDADNNVTTETQWIQIVDTTDPTIAASATITIEATAASSTILAATLGVSATDIVDSSVVLTVSPETLPLGTDMVTWTATDDSGNMSTLVQTVTVEDTSGPVITAPPNVTITPPVMFPDDANKSPTVVVSFENLGGTATATDLVEGMIDGANITSEVDGQPFVSGDSITVAINLTGGSVNVVWSADDGNKDNSSSVTQVVSIFVTDSPVIVISSLMIAVEATGLTTIVKLGKVIAVDAQDGSLTPTPDNLGPFGLGTHTIIWTATDEDSNVTTATQVVQVMDTTFPDLDVNMATEGTMEATSLFTTVELGTATAKDIVSGILAPIATIEVNGSTFTRDSGGSVALPLGEHNVVWSAADSSGNTATAVKTISITDDDAPVISFTKADEDDDNLMTIKADSRQIYLSNVMDDLGIDVMEVGIASYDINLDGKAIENGGAFLSGGLHLISGAHTLGLTVVDHADLIDSDTLTIHITPRVDFAGDQVVGVGSDFSVESVLTGPAVAYPVTIPFAIDSIASLTATTTITTTGTITITGGESGSVDFTVADNITVDASLTFSVSGEVTNANLDGTPTHVVTIQATNIAPNVNPSISQSATNVVAVTPTGGEVAIMANAVDVNGGSLTFSWDGSDASLIAALVSGTDSVENVLKLDPSTLDTGTYSWQVQVTDILSLTTTVNGSLLVFEQSATPTVLADMDSDGIPDDLDNPDLPPEVLQKYTSAGDTVALVVAEPGIDLGLGTLALNETIDGDEVGGVAIALTQLGDVAATLGDFEAVELFDFKASSLPEVGSSINIVFPLQVPTSSDARLRKYDPANGQWRYFIIDDKNKLYTAVDEDPQGVCPTVNDSSYVEATTLQTLDNGNQTAQLPGGNYCIQMRIEDGGLNDNDGLANSIILDPFAVQSVIVSTLTGVKSSPVNSVPDGFASLGDTDVEMLRFNLESSSPNLEVGNLTLTAGGDISSTSSQAGDERLYVANVKLYQVASIDAAPGGSPIGMGRFDGDNGILVITFANGYSLNMGANYFVVTYDFSTLTQLNEFGSQQ